jgi:hypothetical protein
MRIRIKAQYRYHAAGAKLWHISQAVFAEMHITKVSTKCQCVIDAATHVFRSQRQPGSSQNF